MQIAILSDIHGNGAALRAVLADMAHHKVDGHICCGDVIGYYYDSAFVWQSLLSLKAVMCRGNHEQILLSWLKGDQNQRADIRSQYGSSYRLISETVSADVIYDMVSLPHPVPLIIDGIRFLISHGAPWDEDAYLYPDKLDQFEEQLSAFAHDYDVLCMGHTHYQMNESFLNVQLINPGSVGQPRSGREMNEFEHSRAQWALYDTQNRNCTLMTTLYDPRDVFAQIDQYDPDLLYLKKVLKRGELPV